MSRPPGQALPDATLHLYSPRVRGSFLDTAEKGQLASAPCASLPAALKEFEKKFKDKTKNDWSQRANFTKVNGKYELLERDYGTDDPPQPAPSVSGEAPREAAVSKLDSRVQR